MAASSTQWSITTYPAGTLTARLKSAIRTLTELTTLEVVPPGRSGASLPERSTAVARYVDSFDDQDVLVVTTRHGSLVGYLTVRRCVSVDAMPGPVDAITTVAVRQAQRRHRVATSLIRHLQATAARPVVTRPAGPAHVALLDAVDFTQHGTHALWRPAAASTPLQAPHRR